MIVKSFITTHEINYIISLLFFAEMHARVHERGVQHGGERDPGGGDVRPPLEDRLLHPGTQFNTI